MVKAIVRGPLQGLKVLDLTHVWAGPLAVRFLADLGAQVVKVEAPYGRGPQVYPSTPIGGWLGGEPGDEPWNVNALFNKLHRNRQSLCIDLKHADARKLFLQLVAMADIVIENFSARAMPSMGLGYDVLQQANPNVIYVSMPGFGASGPYRDRVAFGPIVEPMSGLTTMLGYDQSNPRNSAMALMDPIAATHAASAVLSALRQRERDGRGAYVELSLHECGVAYSGPWLVGQQLGDASLHCHGNGHPMMVPHGVFKCAGEDQWLALACESDAQWQGLCSLVTELDASFTYRQRRESEQQIEAQITAWTSVRDKCSAAKSLQGAGVPAGEVNTVPDMLADPQVKAREFFVAYERFDTPMPGNPMRVAGTNSADWTACPGLGESNESVLREWLNKSPTEIKRLESTGALHNKPPA